MTLPEGVRRAIDDRRYLSPTYGGFLSNHLPMTCMALTALGAPESDVVGFAQRYAARLAPVEAGSSYARHLRRFDNDIDRLGVAATLHAHLPTLVTGWTRDAYHPLIRIAYGVEFDHTREVAAGLAYLASCGTDGRVARLAAAAQATGAAPAEVLAQLAEEYDGSASCSGTFTQRAQTVIDGRTFERVNHTFTDNLETISALALRLFAATGNFFALHLVTGTHAFRVCYPYAGPHRDAVLNVGVLTGFLAIGGPALPPEQHLPADTDTTARGLLELCRDDEHDVKIAYTAWRQRSFWNDPAYVAAAAAYLRRGGRTSGREPAGG